MRKIKFLDERVRSKFSGFLSYFSMISSIALIFFNIPDNIKIYLFIIFAICLILFYFRLWSHLNNLREIELDVEGSKVTVKSGDLFKQDGLKAIAFNEYFDTQVDEIIISSRSLNGTYIKKYFRNTTSLLDDKIENYDFDESEYIEINNKRKKGKTKKYSLGTICVVDDFILTAFSRFDEDNKAYLTMPDYLSFLITFWDKVNKIYAQRDVSVPIFGSGITRIKEHRNISDEELLKIML